MRPDVSIILVSWNTRDLLLACLESLPSAVGDLIADVWVVDNASSDDSVAMLQTHHPTVNLIVNPQNVGFAAANNQAIEASAGRYVLLLNSDTLALPQSIERLVRFADMCPQAGAVGPMLLNPDGSFQDSFADFPSFRNELLSVTGLGRRLYGSWYPGYGPNHAKAPRLVDYISGACMLVRRATVDRVGLMDEQYFMYSEEIDWCLRMCQAGWEIWFTPAGQVIHYGGQSSQQWRAAMLRALYRSKVRFFRKHYGAAAASVLQASFVVVLRLKWLAEILRAAGRVDAEVGPAISWEDLRVGALLEPATR
jgi:GT2 family glycosyltransferase